MPSASPLTTGHAGRAQPAPERVRDLRPVRRRPARADDRHRRRVLAGVEQARSPDAEQRRGRVRQLERAAAGSRSRAGTRRTRPASAEPRALRARRRSAPSRSRDRLLCRVPPAAAISSSSGSASRPDARPRRPSSPVIRGASCATSRERRRQRIAGLRASRSCRQPLPAVEAVRRAPPPRRARPRRVARRRGRRSCAPPAAPGRGRGR